MYELVVRHFLACVSQPAVGAETTVEIDIAGELFSASGRVIVAVSVLYFYCFFYVSALIKMYACNEWSLKGLCHVENLNISSYMKYEPNVRRNGLVQMKVLPSTLYRQKFICTVKTYYLLLIITFFFYSCSTYMGFSRDNQLKIALCELWTHTWGFSGCILFTGAWFLGVRGIHKKRKMIFEQYNTSSPFSF